MLIWLKVAYAGYTDSLFCSANASHNVTLVTPLCLQWCQHHPDCLGHISKLDKQLLINSFICFCQCQKLHCSADLGNDIMLQTLWYQQWQQHQLSVYIGHSSKWASGYQLTASFCFPYFKTIFSKLYLLLLAHITQQIWFPHCKYRLCYPYSAVYLAYICEIGVFMWQNTTNYNCFKCYCHTCARDKYAHQNAHMCLIFHGHV